MSCTLTRHAETGDTVARNPAYDRQRREGYANGTQEAKALTNEQVTTMAQALSDQLAAPADPHTHPSDYAYRLGRQTAYIAALNDPHRECYV